MELLELLAAVHLGKVEVLRGSQSHQPCLGLQMLGQLR